MIDFFKTHNIEESVIAVGVSGGADSLALALMLNEMGKKVVALTVNHCLRKEASSEAEYVAELMRKNEIEHHILLWNEGVTVKKGLEQAETPYHVQDYTHYQRNHIQREQTFIRLCIPPKTVRILI